MERLLTQFEDSLLENCQLGASVGTLASLFGVPPELLKKWIDRGKTECAKYDKDFVETAYMRLWNLVSEGWAKARLLAEADLHRRNPEKFLQSKTSKILGTDWEEETQQTEEQSEHETRLEVGDQLLESLKGLRRQGFDLNDIIDQNTLQLKMDPPKKKQQDILEENGLTQSSKVSSSLPDSFDD